MLNAEHAKNMAEKPVRVASSFSPALARARNVPRGRFGAEAVGFPSQVCAACSIISVLTQWGATLVIQLRGTEGQRDRGTEREPTRRPSSQGLSPKADIAQDLVLSWFG